MTDQNPPGGGRPPRPRPTARRRWKATRGITPPTPPAGGSDDPPGGGGTGPGPGSDNGRVVIDSLADRTVNPQVKTMLRDLYGRTPTGGVDTAAAAAGAGVSRRTVQRWLQQGLPKAGSVAGERLRAAWQHSPAGRRRRVSPQRRAELRRGAITGCTVAAAVTVSEPDPRNGDVRTFKVWLQEGDTQNLLQAMAEGDESAARAFEAIASRGFGGTVDLDLRAIHWKQ